MFATTISDMLNFGIKPLGSSFAGITNPFALKFRDEVHLQFVILPQGNDFKTGDLVGFAQVSAGTESTHLLRL